jgi:hypothetical protein
MMDLKYLEEISMGHFNRGHRIVKIIKYEYIHENIQVK